MRNRILVSSFGVVAVMAAGCSSGTEVGSASLASSNSAAPGQPGVSGLPSDGAPRVTSPLDVSTIEADPCNAVTTEQIESLGSPVRSAKQRDASGLGVTCSWRLYDGSTRHGSIGAGLVTANTSGLSVLYEKNSSGGLTTFEPVADVAGYPGVFYANSTVPAPGVCTLAVGVRDDITYTVTIQADTQSPNRDDPCPVAVKVAEFAINNIKGGS